MAGPVARRHHYVPQLYLRGFAVPRKKGHQTLVIDRPTGRAFPASIANIAVETDFNTIEVEGHPPDAVEKGLAEFEGELAPALGRVVAARAFPNDDDRNWLMNLIALLALRNPRLRERMGNFQKQVLTQMMQLMLHSKERWERQLRQARAAGHLKGLDDIEYATIREDFDRGALRIEIPTESHIPIELKLFDDVLPTIGQRKWVFLVPQPDAGGFITSDHPVCLLWTDPGMRRGIYGPGFGLAGTEVLFPVAHNLAVVGAFEFDRDNDVIPASLSMVARFNAAVAAHAERQVYAKNDSFHYQPLPTTIRKGSRLASDQWFRRPARERPDEHEVLPRSVEDVADVQGSPGSSSSAD